MNGAKFLIAAGVVTMIYFAFFAKGLPREVEFRGQSLGPRQEVTNNSIKNFDIYQYRDRTNHHVLLFVMAKDESASAQQLLEFYIANFKAQGYRFRKKDERYLGTKGDEVIYMTRAPQIDSAIAYIVKAPDPFPDGFRDAGSVFTELESWAF